MTKVVCIHLYNDFSGSPFILSQFINILSENNYIIDLYTSNTKGFLSNTQSNKFNVFYKRSNNKVGVLFYYLLSQFILFFKLLKYKNEDVIFYINTIMPFGAALAGKFLGKKVIYHIHETSIRPKILKLFLKKIISMTSSFNIFVSKYLMESDKIKNISSSVIYNALPEYFINKANLNEYKANSDIFTVLMICSLKEYKGVKEFIDIAAQCKEISNIKFKLILNAQQEEINLFFKDIVIPNNVILFPSQKDVSTFYSDANLVLNLSRVDQWIETFGMTILEAMSYGIPCIVPPIGGPTEIVEEEKEGYLISSYEIDKISKLIQELSKDKQRCIRLSKNAIKKAKKFNYLDFEKNIINSISSIEEGKIVTSK